MSGSMVIEIAGIHAVKSTTISKKTTIGTPWAAIFRSDSPMMPEAMNRFSPSGGVMKPTEL